MKTERKEWVDIAKAIAIALMILGHTGYPEIISKLIGIPHFARNWIYSFHMPLFFLLSGALTNWTYGYKEFVLHKSKTLLSYLVIYSIINVLLLKVSGAPFDEHSFIHVLQNGWGGFALWFLAVLYISLILARILCNRNTLCATATLLGMAWCLAHFGIELPWALSTVPYATSLILIGKIAFPYMLRVSEASSNQTILTVSSSLICCCAVALLCPQQDLLANKILPLIPMLLGGGIRRFLHLSSVKQIMYIYRRKENHVTNRSEHVGNNGFFTSFPYSATQSPHTWLIRVRYNGFRYCPHGLFT